VVYSNEILKYFGKIQEINFQLLLSKCIWHYLNN
jgi:hypothetical protein